MSANSPTAPPASAREIKRLALLLVGGALVSKMLGLVREVLVARAIGASLIADSFRGAVTATLLPLAFLQSESVPAVLIPTYKEWQAEGTAPQRYAALVVSQVVMALAICALVEVAAPLWIDLLLGGFSPAARELTITFTRIIGLSMPATVLLSCLSAVEIARHQSRITSLRAMLVNVAVIAGVIVLLWTGWAVALAWAFSAAFVIVAGGALVLVTREGALDWNGLTAQAVLDATILFFRRLRPLMLQPITEKGQVWIERLLASTLAVGTLASLDYARTISDCAVLLVSQPLGLAVLSAGPSRDVRGQAESLARPILAIGIPASIFVVAFAPDIVTVIFHRGAFDAHAVETTSEALRGIAIGLWATTLGWILVRMLNGLGRNRRATTVVAVAYAANALVSAALLKSFGGFALGLGEAVRGFVVMAGVVMALGAGSAIFRLVLTLTPGAALLGAAEWAVHATVQSVWARLAAGAGFAGITAGLLCLLVVPAMRGFLVKPA